MNWVRDCKANQCDYKLDSLSFGKVFKQDPWDCGVPQCPKCGLWKIEDKAKRRQSLRNDERKGLKDLD